MAEEETDIDKLIGAPTKAPQRRTPPYIAYRTLQTLLSEFKTNGLPPRVDRSVLSRFAGGLQGQIMLALRSLGLMDSENKPTQRLAHLVDIYETPQFKPEFRAIIEETYPYVFALDLTTATPSMFAEAFKNNIEAKEEVLRKVRTFFLHAAKDVGIVIGPRIEKAKFPRSRGNGAPRKPKGGKVVEPANAAEQLNTNTNTDDGGGFMDKLLAKFPEFDPNWPDPIKEKWFEGFDKFMKKAATDQ